MAGLDLIRAVIYDVDGTLINSEPLHVRAWDEALRRYGRRLGDLSGEFRTSMAGRKPIAIATDMVTKLQLRVEPAELLASKADMLLEAVRFGVEEMPGAVASVKRFKRAGLRLGIGAALDRRYVDLVLEQLGSAGMFEVIVTGDIIKRGKPDPETYALAVEQLGLQADECMVFEDAKSGIESATAAGCWCIAIANPEADQNLSKADKVVRSWDEIGVRVLREWSTA